MDSMDHMKNCPQCGGQVQSTAKFCGECGYRFPAEETVQSPVKTGSVNELKIPAPPEIKSFAAPAPEQSVNSGLGAPAPEQPVNSGLGASAPEQPASGNYGSQAYTQPAYPPYSPVQPPQKKGKGGLIALFSVLGILVLAGTVLAAGILAGWFSFEKKEIVLSETKVTVLMEDDVTIKVENYSDIGKPELTATVQEGKEDYIEVAVNGSKITVTGIEAGKNIIVTISAKGCEDASFKVTVEEPEEEVKVELSKTAWDAEGFKYYFLENGTMYMISEEQENYIRGTYTITDLTQEKAENYAGGEDPFSGIADGVYFLVEVDVEQELYYGNEYEGDDDYYLVVCTNGKKCEIYDSSWDYVFAGSSAVMETESDLDSYFDMSSSGGGGSAGSIVSGSVPGVNFGRAINVKETWHIAKYESNNGDILIFKKDGNLWGINENGGNAVQLTSLGEGLQVTIFAVYKDYLFYGVGSKEEDGVEVFYASTNAFYKVDLSNEDVELLSDDIALKDFVIYDNTIYYTDYATLYKMDFKGNIETLYEYGVFTFEVTDDYVFIFDGYDWEAIDPEDGTDYGYLVRTDGEYEADVVRDEDEILFFTVYNYDEGNVYLYAMDYDGNVTQIGDAYWGDSIDTYNVAFDGKYVIYTVNGGEMIVKTDVTSGSYETMILEDQGYWYATGMTQWGDDIYLYVWDDYGDAYYLELDVDDLSVEEIPGVTAQ